LGQYKVPQNVEAEDRIIGPLTFRQFIYALSGFGWGAVCFALFRTLPILLVVVGFPPVMLLMLLAFYQRDGQNFEQLLIAMVDYFAASHHRLWVKENVAETFHIEPTKVVAEATQRNPALVRSELEKLAILIDSRGWNIPADVQPEANVYALPTTAHEDRIVAPPPPAPKAPGEATAQDDMFDMQHSPLAQNLASLLNQAANDVREEAMDQMTSPGPRPAPAPLATAMATNISGVTPGQSGDIVRLATQNDDLTVSQVAAQATRMLPTVPRVDEVET
jgi:hypothetical protein